MIAQLAAAIISALSSKSSGGIFTGGFLLAIDNVPPFTVKFENEPMYKDNFSAEYSYASYPGARFQHPMFKGCTPHEISFILKYDLARQSKIPGSGTSAENIIKSVSNIDGIAGGSINTDALSYTNESSVGNGKSIRFKGPDSETTDVMKLLQVDYLSRIRACIEAMKMPKAGVSLSVQAVSGKILQMSQGSSDPAPPLLLLCRNPNKFYLGYLAEGEIEELQYDRNMCCTRMEITCKFLVAPDIILTTFSDILREANLVASSVTTL